MSIRGNNIPLLCLIAAISAATAYGQTSYTWTGATTDWGTASNWNPNTGTPISGDTANFIDVVPPTSFSTTGTGAVNTINISSTTTAFSIGTALTIDNNGAINVLNTDTVAAGITVAPTFG